MYVITWDTFMLLLLMGGLELKMILVNVTNINLISLIIANWSFITPNGHSLIKLGAQNMIQYL